MKRILLYEFDDTLPTTGIGDYKERYDTVEEAKAAPAGDSRTTQMVVQVVSNANSTITPVPVATRHGDGEWLDGDHYAAFAQARRTG
jgi:hypothetical protein